MTTNRKIGVALTADPSQLQAGLRTASSAAQQFAASTDQAFGRVSASTARLSQASTALGAATNQQTLAGRAHQVAADRFVRDLERKVTAIGKTRSELLSLQAAELGVANQAAPLIARIRESEQALGAGAIEFNKFGLSAKQTEAALRGVPAQITDIVVSLQSGQRPMTVLLQQGGQLKDMFGGVVPAAKALSTTLLGMVNPYTVAAAGAAALFAAYRSGSSELDAFNQHLTMTGGALGVSANQVSAFAEQMDRVAGVTRGGAVRALTDVATSGKIAGDQMQMVAEVALRSSQLLGRETSEVIEEFAKLADEPSKAAAELNEKYNFLTTSVYQQIRALEEQGRTQDAARLASEEFGRVTTERLGEVERSLGYIARSWRAVSSVAKEAWDTMANLGRPSTISEMIAESESRLDQLRDAAYERGAVRRTEQVRQEEALLASLRAQLDSEEEALGLEQARAEIRKNFIEAEQRWQKGAEEFLTKSQRMEKEISQARADGLRLKLSEHEIEQRIAAIRDKYTQKQSGGISTTQTELARLNAVMEAERQREEALHSVGLAQANLNEGERLAIQYAEKLKLATDEKTKSQLAANKALAEEYGARKRANDVFEKELKDRQSAIDTARKQTLALRDQIETYGMGKSAIEELTIARLEERLAIAEGEPELAKTVEGLREEIAARKELLSAMRTKEQLDAQLKEWQAWEREVDRIFDQLGQSLTDQLFEGGKSARDLIKDLFKTLTLRVFIQPMMGQMQNWVTQNLGGMFGVQNPQQQGGGMLGTAQNLYSGYNAITGGLNSTLGNAAQWLGQKVGSEALTSFGLGLSGTTAATGIASIGAGLGASLGTTIGTSAAAMTSTTFAASMTGGAVIPGLGVGVAGGGVGAGIGAAGAAGAAGAGGAAAGGAAGLGAAVGTALPWVAGGLALASAFGLFGDDEPRTRHAQMSHADLQADGRFAVTTWDDRQSRESQIAAAAYATEAVRNATELFGKIGIDAAFTRFTTLMESSILGDKQGVGSSGTIRIGDLEHEIGLAIESSWTKHGVGGWSEAEMLPRLMTDVQLTILEAFQAAGDQLPSVLSGMLEGVDIRSLGAEQAQALAQQFSLVVEQVSSLQAALEQLPFANLRDLSFDAAANLIQFAGSLEALESGMSTYFQSFYSQEEQLAFATERMTGAFADLGFTMPDLSQGADSAKSAYRGLVESLDMTTEEGQRAYVTLMSLAGGFSELVTGLDELASATARAAEETARAAEQDARNEFERLARVGEYQLQVAISQLNTAWSAVQRFAQEEITRLQQSFSATDGALRSYQTAVRSLESELGSLFSTIDRGVADLRGQVDATAQMQYAQARAVISTALVTGQLPQTADLTEAMRIAQQGVTGQIYASQADQERAYLRLANEMEAVKELAKPELDAAQATLREMERQYNLMRGISSTGDASLSTLEKQLVAAIATEENARIQIAGIESQLAWHEREFNALMGIDGRIVNLTTAMQAFGAAVTAVKAAQANPVNRDQRYYEAKLDQLRRENPNYGGVDWTTATVSDLAAYFRKEGMTPEQHYKLYGRYEGLSYDTGTSYVPYDMMANIHKGEIIIDPRSSDILRRYGIGVQGAANTQALERRVDELVAENRKMSAYLYQITKEAKRTALNTEDTATAIAYNPSDDVVVVF